MKANAIIHVCCAQFDSLVQLSEIGHMANKFWKDIPEHFPFVELDECVIMPNHVHGIIIINKPNDGDIMINVM